MATVRTVKEHIVANGGGVDRQINDTGQVLYGRKQQNKKRAWLSGLQHEGDASGSPLMGVARRETTWFNAFDNTAMYCTGRLFEAEMNII